MGPKDGLRIKTYMDLRKLKGFFSDEVDIDFILTDIAEEVQAYKKALAKTGASAPVYETNSQFTFVVKKEHIRRLCELFLMGKISDVHINYLANLIELSEAFELENDEVEEALFELSSPELNCPISIESVGEILNRLS